LLSRGQITRRLHKYFEAANSETDDMNLRLVIEVHVSRYAEGGKIRDTTRIFSAIEEGVAVALFAVVVASWLRGFSLN
jgi:hypothetical protein